jgi:F420-0:gamma-glutamyl ligase
MITTPIKTRIFLEWENLSDFIREHITELHDGDVLAITSKIVALSESRTFVAKNPAEKLEYVKSESTWYARTKYVHLTMHDRMPMANAGIDESNGNGKCIMLPKNSYERAYMIWRELREYFSLEHLGIVITDSRTIPFRQGTIGISLGHMWFEGIRDYVGKSDIFGRPFLFARTNMPDALAVSAVHTMGEGDECQPLVIIQGSGCMFTQERQTGDDLIIDPDDDMYGPLFVK